MRIRLRHRKRKSLGCLLFQIIGALILVGLIWAAARAFEFYATGG
jgi:predicted nucleic acid-binding Zn ribbon protein